MEDKMGQRPVLPLILQMSLPTMFSMLVISLYNIVDSYFVSLIGEEAFRAVSMVYPVFLIIIAVSVGTGVGVNVMVARSLGEGKPERASEFSGQGLSLTFLWALLFAALGYFFTESFFTFSTRDPRVFSYGVSYMKIITIYSVFLIVQCALEKIIQGTGQMVYPMLSQLVGAVVNMILDPLMIFGKFGFPALGIQGAAWATIISEICGTLFCLVYFFLPRSAIRLSPAHFLLRGRDVWSIYEIGFPSILMQSVPALLNFLLNKIFAQINEMAVSVLGIYLKLQSFVFMPIFGLVQGIMPIFSYNYGAKNKVRIRKALQYSLAIALGIMILGTFVFECFPGQLIALFSDKEEILHLGVLALRITALAFIPASLTVVATTFFQSMGNGMESLLLSLFRQILIILPAVWVLSRYDLALSWWAWPLAEIFTFFLSLLLLKRVYRRKVSPLSTEVMGTLGPWERRQENPGSENRIKSN